MAYQETNDLLGEVDNNPDELTARKEDLLERVRLQKAGVLKRIAQKILAKAPGS